jgi:uncharacterized damage-inducible protein DinB
MNADDIRTRCAYNRWATNRLLEAVSGLDHADFTHESGTSHGSLRGTFVHLVWVDWIWLQRWQGHSPKTVFDQNRFPTLEIVGTLWREVDRTQQKLLRALTDDRLTARVSYENLQGQRWEYSLAQMMQHVVNHSSYHRDQLVTLLPHLGTHSALERLSPVVRRGRSLAARKYRKRVEKDHRSGGRYPPSRKDPGTSVGGLPRTPRAGWAQIVVDASFVRDARGWDGGRSHLW